MAGLLTVNTVVHDPHNLFFTDKPFFTVKLVVWVANGVFIIQMD